MFKSSKLVLGIIVALSLMAASPAAAKVPAPSMTRAEWILTDGYAALEAAGENSNTLLATQTGIHLDVAISATVGTLSSVSETVQVDATKTAARAKFNYSENIYGSSKSGDYYFIDGVYVQTLESFKGTDTLIKNLPAVLQRLSTPSSASVNTNSDVTPTGLFDINPSKIFDSSTTDPLESSTFGTLTGEFLFGPVVQSANLDGVSQDFTFDLIFTSASLGTLNMNIVETFDAQGLLTKMVVAENFLGGLANATVSIAQSINNDLVITAPTQVVSVATLTNAGHKLDAERMMTPRAKAIAAKAAKIAKATGATLKAKHITAAATALHYMGKKVKYPGKPVKNGLKFTTTNHGISGSMCVIAVKGKAVASHC